MQLNPYLFFKGNCKDAFTFYEKVLGGKIIAMMTHGETPAAEHTKPEWQDKIIHARMTFGDQVLMASDAPPEHHRPMQGFSVSLSVEEPAEADRIFDAFSEAGEITMPIQETFWAHRFGMLVDRFGTPWMINCEKKQ
jgi:PhnB protein